MERIDMWTENGLGETVSYHWPARIRGTLRDEADASCWIDVHLYGVLIGCVTVSPFGKRASNIFDAMRALQVHLKGDGNHNAYEGFYICVEDRAPYTMFPGRHYDSFYRNNCP